MRRSKTVIIARLQALTGGLIAGAILPHSLLAGASGKTEEGTPFKQYIEKAKEESASRLERQFRLTSNSWGNVFIWGGAQLANPYSIQKKDDGDLKKGAIVGGNSQFQGFISANLNLRYVLRGESGRDWPFSSNDNDGKKPIIFIRKPSLAWGTSNRCRWLSPTSTLASAIYSKGTGLTR